MKNKFGFILIKPQLGENIGACARSMKNFGFNKLHIVSPKISFPNHKAKAISVGAFDIINKAKVFNETKEAISNFDIVLSLSARRRDINKKHISLNEFINIITRKNNSIDVIVFSITPPIKNISVLDLKFHDVDQHIQAHHLLLQSFSSSISPIN